jgi:hypothetical protein
VGYDFLFLAFAFLLIKIEVVEILTLFSIVA